MMELIRLTKENLEAEHICCAISNNADIQVKSKKAWLADRFYDGLVFLRGDVRGKCFIEYIPAENAWAPVTADNYMYIDCLWVSGQFKGQGNSTLLMDECVRDSKSKGKDGLCVLSAVKKTPFLSDPKYLGHVGFKPCDSAPPYYVLYCLPFNDNAAVPRFNETVKQQTPDGTGYVLYYSHGCPFTAKYVPVAAETAQRYGVPLKTVRFESAKQAQSSPAVFTQYSMFYNGTLITNEILSPAKLEKLFSQAK